MATATDSVVELKTALAGRLEAVDRMTNAITVDGSNVSLTADLAADLQKGMAEVNEIKGLLDTITGVAEMKQWLATPETENTSVGMAAAAMGQAAAMGLIVPGGGRIKSIGEAFVSSDQFNEFAKSGQFTMRDAFMIEGKSEGGWGRKDVYTNMSTNTTPLGMGQTQFDPVVPRGQRTARVRDLFPAAQTSAALIEFFRVIGFGSNSLDLSSSARPVADRTAADGVSAGNAVFGLKPHSSLTFEPDQAPVRTIAHYEVAHRNVLMDAPQLQSTINNELLYGLALQEDFQILSGSGSGENLRGILNTPNIQTYTPTSAEVKSDSLRRAATLSALAYYPSTGYVIHPNDWEDVELQKGSGDGQYMLFTNIAIGADQRVWRQPVVDTPAIPEGTFLTGAFGLGAQLYDRMQASIRIAEQHADFFIRNAVAILAEERIALAVKRPESFVKGSYNAA